MPIQVDPSRFSDGSKVVPLKVQPKKEAITA